MGFGGFGDLNQKWSVNFKFLPSDVFYSVKLTFTVLAAHVYTLYLFGRRLTRVHGGFCALLRARPKIRSDCLSRELRSEHVLWVLCVSNFVGVAFARSLHFQFYSWYFHALPFLLWSCESMPTLIRLFIFAALEYAWSYGLEQVLVVSSAVMLWPCHECCIDI